ncbi:MAG: DNA polymerase III subunit delta [Verrucomicrobia bacterium]|nr:DNA polymerase III subunit delta [Verrucomicrobiota bacterium]
MAATGSNSGASVHLVCGDDEFAVKQRARELYQRWCQEAGGMDHEIVDAAAGNSGEALRALAKLREALQTLPFFGGAKVVWFQNCNFLGEERTAEAGAVTETLGEIAQELKSFRWDNVRLLISAGKADKRKTFFKTLEKIGEVELYAALSLETKDWAGKAENAALKQLRALQKAISTEALARLVNYVGPNLRQLASEVDKLAAYVGTRAEIETVDVDAIVTRNKLAKAFALGDAVGDRDLPRALRTLDEELWEIRAKIDKDKSEIGLLYGLISKVRAMVFLKEMLAAGWLKANFSFEGYGAYDKFKAQLERVPADAMPADKRFNPLAMNAYVLFKALPQAQRYSRDELVRAMELLLDANCRLVGLGSAGEARLILQQTLTQIIRRDDMEKKLAA